MRTVMACAPAGMNGGAASCSTVTALFQASDRGAPSVSDICNPPSSVSVPPARPASDRGATPPPSRPRLNYQCRRCVAPEASASPRHETLLRPPWPVHSRCGVGADLGLLLVGDWWALCRDPTQVIASHVLDQDGDEVANATALQLAMTVGYGLLDIFC